MNPSRSVSTVWERAFGWKHSAWDRVEYNTAMGMVKSGYDIEQLRHAGRITAEIVAELGSMVQPGNNAGELEERAQELCREHGVTPAFQGYQGYKYGTCIGVNEEVVHAIPYRSKVFQEGDLVKIDFGVRYNGYYSDHCRTFAAGTLQPVHQELLDVGEAATANAVALARAGNTIGDLSHAMQSTAEEAGFSIVRTFIGHGIGKKLHEPPEIPAFGEQNSGLKLRSNMVLCIECQVCERSAELVHDRDGWTTRTKDGGYSVMFESMTLVTDERPEVLSRVS